MGSYVSIYGMYNWSAAFDQRNAQMSKFCMSKVSVSIAMAVVQNKQGTKEESLWRFYDVKRNV